jgi:hypothetical protein
MNSLFRKYGCYYLCSNNGTPHTHTHTHTHTHLLTVKGHHRSLYWVNTASLSIVQIINILTQTYPVIIRKMIISFMARTPAKPNYKIGSLIINFFNWFSLSNFIWSRCKFVVTLHPVVTETCASWMSHVGDLQGSMNMSHIRRFLRVSAPWAIIRYSHSYIGQCLHIGILFF